MSPSRCHVGCRPRWAQGTTYTDINNSFDMQYGIRVTKLFSFSLKRFTFVCRYTKSLFDSKQVAAVMTVKATSLLPCIELPIPSTLLVKCPPPPKKVHFPWGHLGLHLIHYFLILSLCPKKHLDWFSCFRQVAVVTSRQTDHL